MSRWAARYTFRSPGAPAAGAYVCLLMRGQARRTRAFAAQRDVSGASNVREGPICQIVASLSVDVLLRPALLLRPTRLFLRSASRHLVARDSSVRPRAWPMVSC